MDELHIEQAELFVAQEREQKLQEIANAVKPETHPDFDGAHCVECGNAMTLQEKSTNHYICNDCTSMTCTRCGKEEIPKERVKLGKVKCVHCQSELELHKKTHWK